MSQMVNHPTGKPGRRQAVVIGGSMAGLFAARVLSEHFEQVTILDRDSLPDEVVGRPMVGGTSTTSQSTAIASRTAPATSRARLALASASLADASPA